MKISNVIIIIIGLLILSISSYMLYRVETHIEAFENDPIIYGVIKHNYDNCICYQGNNYETVYSDRIVRVTQNVMPSLPGISIPK